MAKDFTSRRIVRFGGFEADLESGELRKYGLKIKLQGQPFRILSLLIEHPGEVVTREEIQRELWPADTFVEFEHSLNTAIKRLRGTLGDDADTPRYIETVPRRGYRFIGPVERPVSEDAPLHVESPRPAEPFWRRRSTWITGSLVLLLGCSVAANVVLSRRGVDLKPQSGIRTFSIPTHDTPSASVISPDGKRIAYLTGPGYVATLWIQDLDQSEPRLIAQNTAREPMWSPDGENLAFVHENTLYKVPAKGGLPVLLIRLPGSLAEVTGSWSPDGRHILLGIGPPWKLLEIPAQGGETRSRTLTSGSNERICLSPTYLPSPGNSPRFLCQEGTSGQGRIIVTDFGSRRDVLASGHRPFFSPTGHVLYESSGSLWALPISQDTLKPAGAAVAIQTNAWSASAARDGTLAYLARSGSLQQLDWYDRSGREVGTVGQPQSRMLMPTLSPDASRVLVVGVEGNEEDVWVHDGARGIKTRLTFNSAREDRPVWHPNGKQFSYTLRTGKFDSFLASADGAGDPAPFLASPHPEFAVGWSRDGEYMIFNRMEAQLSDIWYRRRKSDGGAEEVQFIRTEFDELSPHLSPDGRHLAYESNKSGRYEIYVTAFPSGKGEVQISANGGHQPHWRADGKELFYVEGDDTLMVVRVSWSPALSAGIPHPLFKHAALRGRAKQYDVHPDGRRFLLVKTVKEAKPVIRVIQNWFDGPE